MKQGTLVMDTNTGRMDIRFGLDEYYGGLRCGTTMDVELNEIGVRFPVAFADDWYLVGVRTDNIAGLTVRI